MRGHDWINSMLPDELILEIFRNLDSKTSRDACALVCRRWLTLERLSRDTIRIGGSGSPDSLVNLIASRFVNVTNLYIDERLSGAHPFDSYWIKLGHFYEYSLLMQ
ncbi:putative F-box domain-containing protein [Helianthus annuus]|nr:putative F-box domain-containing protein [Helianthus annuus]